MAKAEYKYSSDTFDKHIKLIRSIGINPIAFKWKSTGIKIVKGQKQEQQN